MICGCVPDMIGDMWVRAREGVVRLNAYAVDSTADVGWFGREDLEDMPLTPNLLASLIDDGVM